MEFGERLRVLREKRGLTLKGTANLVGVPISTYREWEYGRKILGEPYLKLAEVFEVSLNELFGAKSGSYEQYKKALEQTKKALISLENTCESIF